MTFDRPSPAWTFDDSWQAAEADATAAPLTEVPCPCNCHARTWRNLHAGCPTRTEAILQSLRTRTPWPEDEDDLGSLAAECWRCYDARVVPAGRDGAPA